MRVETGLTSCISQLAHSHKGVGLMRNVVPLFTRLQTGLGFSETYPLTVSLFAVIVPIPATHEDLPGEERFFSSPPKSLSVTPRTGSVTPPTVSVIPPTVSVTPLTGSVAPPTI